MGDKWWETGHTHKLQASEGHTTNFKTLDPQAVGQQAAHDTLPQALWHDLMMIALLKQMKIHRLTNMEINQNLLREVQGVGSNEPDPGYPNPLPYPVLQVLIYRLSSLGEL